MKNKLYALAIAIVFSSASGLFCMEDYCDTCDIVMMEEDDGCEDGSCDMDDME